LSSESRKASLPYPFLRSEFLEALEDSQSACEASGWLPIHLQLQPEETDEQQSSAFMPLYLKDHSMGEYVFDHSWANAYHENGLDYYPKLVTSVPFTPSIGPRVQTDQQLTSEDCRQLIDEVLNIAEDTGASSWHFLFPSAEQLKLFNDPRLLQRTGVQYQWHNRGYQSFDDFTGTMISRKRKMVRK
jgi:predicted N-acyltransferase